MSTAVANRPESAAPSLRNPIARMLDTQRRYPLAQTAIAVALFAYGAVTIDGFTDRTSLYSVLVLTALLGLASFGQTLVVLAGGIDFSIPAFILLGQTVTLQLPATHHWPTGLAIAAGFLLGLLAGAVSGWVCHRFKVESLVVTLGMSAVVTGAVQVWTKGYFTGAPPQWLMNLASAAGTTFGIHFPPLLVIWAVIAVVAAVVLHRTVTGRRFFAVGTNPLAAQFSLVTVGRHRILVYALSAGLAALVGTALAGFASGDPSAGNPYLFESLAAVVIGGSSFGGRGDYSRTVVGAFVIVLLSTILVGRGLDDAAQQIIYGLLILVIVGGYGRQRHIRNQV